MGYCLSGIVSWYQKKIGTYDKQPWEKTVEQRILSGFTHVPKKTAKLKTELIDLDLVRGSSFTKAKPKHGIVTVTKFAVVRLLFLPLYTEWWSQQTSPRLVPILLLLYSLEIVNVALYCWAISSLPDTLTQGLLASEVIVPCAMMLFLAVLHSEIVSPHSAHHQTELTSVSRPRRVPPKRHRLTRPPSADKYHSECGEANSNNIGDMSAKFNNKRVRSRRLSFEDGSCIIRQPRRSVAWDTSPIDTPHRLNLQSNEVGQPDSLQRDVPSPPPSPTHSTVDKVDDDGFESLNSTASSDQSDQGQPKAKPTVDQTNDQLKHLWPPLNGRKPSVVLGSYHRSSGGGGGDGVSSGETDHKDSDSEEGGHGCAGSGCSGDKPAVRLLVRRRGSQALDGMALETRRRTTPQCQGESSYQSSEDGETCGALTGGCTTSAAEWMGITTNSEDCSDDSLPASADLAEHPFASEFFPSPASAILSPSCASSDKVSCTMWEKREVKKADLSVLDISSAIIARVEAMPENMDYFYGGMIVSVLLGLVPVLYRLGEFAPSFTSSSSSPLGNTGSGSGALSSSLAYSESVCLPPPSVSSTLGLYHLDFYVDQLSALVDTAFGDNIWERSISVIGLLERTALAGMFFFLLAVAERTFKQKFLYAKFFSHLTSFRRARKSELPHFRLNKVRNIKTWLSVRSYLKKRGPQHSVDAIVSSVFLITLLLISFLSVELLKDSERLHSNYNIEALAWCIVLGLFLLRFMTLGTKINRKYRNLSVLITEQINLYLQIEQKPNKKEELMVANSVLKLAADLLKELECPYKISGFSANPYLYTITKVVVLSALSGVLSEMLGFKLKLHKIKIK